ncbi:AIR synthase-related protein [Halorussus caseinilyticus]|uniref:AIR synthase-related protein n=1 Tax=Halorussus caseinilyticus TaxID=3034025 RepID=A0ABD5WJ59_9EURY
MTGTKEGYDAPPAALSDDAADSTLLAVGDSGGDRLGGSEYLAQTGGSDRFPALPENPREVVETLAEIADHEATAAVHDVSHGGLAVALAEMVTDEAGATADVASVEALFAETPGRAVVATTDAEAVREAFEGVAPVAELGEADDSGALSLTVDGESLNYGAAEIADLRDVLARELD